MSNLPTSGINVQAQGVSAYLGALDKMLSASQDFFKGTTTGSADASKAYAKLEDAAQTSLGRIETLTNRLDLQKRTYEQLQNELAKTAVKFGENSEQADKKRLALDKLGNAISETERSLANERTALSKTQEEMERSESGARKLGTAFVEGAKKMEDVTDIAKKVGSSIKNFIGDVGEHFDKGGRSASVFGEIMTGALRRIGEIGIDALGDGLRAAADATRDFVKDALDSAGDVEQTLNVLQVVGDATDAQMAQISRRAIELGADLTLPATSAQDASRAMLELAKAGLSVDNVMGAARGTMQLAAAGQLDAADAAEITANALNSFRLSGDKAIVVADMLAAAAAKSSVEVVDVADSFKMASAVFSAFQGPVVGAEESMKQLTAAIALLGNAGVKGSDAGTSLKQMLLQLTGPSQKAKEQMQGMYVMAMANVDALDANALAFGNAAERSKALAGMSETTGRAFKNQGDIAYDAAGKMRSLPEIIELVSRATRNLTDEQRNSYITAIFGADAARAVIILMQQGPGAIDAMTASISKQGAASELAGAQMKGWNGMVAGFQSQMETLSLIIGQHLLPILTPLMQQLGQAVGLLTQGDYTGFFANIASVLQQTLAYVTKFFQDIGTGQSILTPFLNSLAASFAPMGQMLIDAASGWFKNFTDWIMKEAPPFLAPIGGMIVEQANKWLDQLILWIEKEAPVFGEKLKLWGDQLIAWIEPQIPVLLEKLNPIIEKLEQWLDDQVPKIQAKLSEWGGLFGEWLINDALPALLKGAWKMWIGFLNWVADQYIFIWDAGRMLMMNFLLGIGREILNLPTYLGDLGRQLIDWIGGGIQGIAHSGGELGRALIDGFGRAIQDGVGWIIDQARNMAQAAANAARAALGMNSPSKVFAEIGLMTDKGFAQGLAKGTPMVQTAMAQMTAPPAYPSSGGGTTIDNSRTIDYHPSYGGQTSGNPQRDSAMARTFAI